MRLFAAVLPPADVVRELAVEVGRLKRLPGADGMRRTGQAGWHFTLAFYGEVDEELLPRLTERLERAAARTEPFRLALRGGGQFGRGKALWTGADGCAAAARKAGLPREEHRRYRAHLTLARSRHATDVQPYLDVMAGFRGRDWTVDELVLVRSTLPVSGTPGEQPRYEVVARRALGAAG